MTVRRAACRQNRWPAHGEGLRLLRVLLVAVLALVPALSAADDGEEFFEKRIRPVLVEHCHECHAGPADELSGELDLTRRAGLIAGGESGSALVPRRPEQSLLARVLSHADATLAMPPNKKLPDAVVADFEKWIRMGAPWPGAESELPAASAKAFVLTDEDRNHWSFRPVAPPADVSIDDLIQAKLNAAGIEAAPLAARQTLIRRLSYDLTGLPPDPDRVAAFVADPAPDAVEKLVDEYLADAGFGTHWARLWLDQLRFDAVDGADLYRQWVVNAFNQNLPYDEFLRRQVAGDLLPANTPEEELQNRIATGFWSFGVAYGEGDLVEMSANLRDEQIDLLGRSVLGLTMACARCHDHKFDPVSQADYYALAGIFKSSHAHKRTNYRRMHPEMSPVLTDAAAIERYWNERKEIREKTYEADRIQQANKDVIRLRQLEGKIDKAMEEQLTDELEVLKRDEELEETRREVATLRADMQRRGWTADEAALDRMRKLRARATALEKEHEKMERFTAMREGGIPGWDETIEDIPLLIRGNPRVPAAIVPRGVPEVLGNAVTVREGSGRRELADWLVSPQNPLTARVMANRIWGHLMGAGIVATADNFGRNGSAPTHPELLDHLAARLMDSGWSMKSLIREIVLSETYRRESRPTASALEKDAGNRLLAYRLRKRLSAEQLSDSLSLWQGKLATDRDRVLWSDVSRRRYDSLRALAVFDAADPRALTPNRSDTTTSPQALFLLNNEQPVDAAQALAQRTSGLATEPRVDQLHRILFARTASETDIALAKEILAGFSQDPWPNYCHALLCANETLYLD